MKTTNELNNTWWYRLVKVVFILAFILVVLVIEALIYTTHGGLTILNNEKTVVTCNTSQEDTAPFPLSEVGPYYYSPEDFSFNQFKYKEFFKHTFNDTAIKIVLRECKKDNPNWLNLIAQNDAIFIQRMVEINNTDLTDEEKALMRETEGNKILQSIKGGAEHLDFSVRMFDIEPAFDSTRVPLYMLGAFLGILFVFEVIRRIFYYIVLGKAYPLNE